MLARNKMRNNTIIYNKLPFNRNIHTNQTISMGNLFMLTAGSMREHINQLKVA